MESHNGMKFEKQATRIKRLYTEFKADKIIIDGGGLGIAVIQEMENHLMTKILMNIMNLLEFMI